MGDKISQINKEVDTVLICSSFFGYALEIVKQLESLGRTVLLFDDRPGNDTITKSILRISPILLFSKSENYFNFITEKIKNLPIKHVLVIKGEAFSVSAIARMRQVLPNTKFILYFWDSYSNMPRSSRSKVGLFDTVFTFDLHDAKADHRLVYRPLFYLDQYVNLPDVKQDIDILFFGTGHLDRYEVLTQIRKKIPLNFNFKVLIYYPSKALFYLRKTFDSSFHKAKAVEFSFALIPRNEILNLMGRSRIIVDIERPNQSGFTIRTIETIGSGKKLITTNPHVIDADFYNCNNVLVIDRVNPSIPLDFISSDPIPLNTKTMSRYSLNTWISEVLTE